MNTKNNYLNFYNYKTDEIESEVAEVRLTYLEKYYPVQIFLSSEIRESIERAREYLDLINRAQEDENFSYDFSAGNSCWIIINKKKVDIECDYINEISENIELSDMKIIIEKWIEFLKNKKKVEYNW
jgi:hypothetical protein